jgi:hypothetical protein
MLRGRYLQFLITITINQHGDTIVLEGTQPRCRVIGLSNRASACSRSSVIDIFAGTTCNAECEGYHAVCFVTITTI